MLLSAGIGHASRAGARITLEGLAPWLKIHSDYGVAQEFKEKRPELKIVGRWVLGADSQWRPFEERNDAEGFYNLFRHHVLSNQAIRFWNTGLNEDNRKLFDSDEYKKVIAAGNEKDIAEWLERNYYDFVPGIDRAKFPNAESPDFPDWVKRAKFEAQIGALLFADGVAPVFCACSVGQPSGSPLEQRGAWKAYHNAIVACKRFGGVMDMHVYHTVAGAIEKVDSLIDHMRATGVVVPIIFGEVGSEPGYRKRIREGEYSSAQYASELITFDNLARQRWPGWVLALCIFAANLGGWGDYDYESDDVIIDAVVKHGQATHNEDASRVIGVDVSAYQDNDETPQRMNFATAKARGATFAFVRASAGSIADSDYEANVNAALGAGLLVGAYHYFNFAVDPRAQATLFLEKVRRFPMTLPPVIDVEQDPFPAWGVSAFRSFVETFEIASGRKLMIYTRAEYWNRTLAGAGFEAGRPLWIASYREESPLMPRGWDKWEFWQFTAQGNGPEWGAESRYIDLDLFNGNLTELKAKYGALAEPILFTLPARSGKVGTEYIFRILPSSVAPMLRLNVKWAMDVRERQIDSGGEWLRVTDKSAKTQLWLKVGA